MAGDRLYALLLRAYPGAFREEYAREMTAAFRVRRRDDRGRAGAWFWAGILADVLATAPRLHAEILGRDVRDAWRSLTSCKDRPFAIAAVLTLALGVGAVTAIFTIVHAVLLAPLPYHDADRVVYVYDLNPARGIDSFASSMPNFLSIRERARSFSSLVALRSADANLTGGGPPERVTGLAVSWQFWGTLGMRPLTGRGFVEADEAEARAAVALIGERLWQRRFGGAASAVGSTIVLNGMPHTIVGVAPQEMGFSGAVDVWLPMTRVSEDEDRGDRRLILLGRLAPGVSLEQAQEEVRRISVDLEREFPADNEGWQMHAVPAREWVVTPEVSRRVTIVFAAVLLLLLVAVTNVANLQVARSSERLREIGVRLALGASRARLVRQMITENVVLAMAGGTLGVGLAVGAVRAASASLPASIPRAGEISVDIPVLAASFFAIVSAALAAGLLPARAAMRANLRDALQQAGRSGTHAKAPARRILAGIQVALATTLVICASLLSQSLIRLQRVPLGFGDPGTVLTARLTRPDVDGPGLDRARQFYSALLEEVRALPGVRSAALASEVPFGEDNTSQSAMPVVRSPSTPREGVQASWRIVTSGYFELMQIPLARGRVFAPRGEPGRSIVLSAGLGARLWPGGEDPIGRQILLSNGRTFTVIGIVADVRHVELASPPTPAMYMSPSWWLWPNMQLVVRAEGDPAALARPIREAVSRIDPAQPVGEFRTADTYIAASAAAPRLQAVLVGSFGVLALVLALVGVVGVVSYTVTQRTRELAVRVAIGASPRQAMRHVMTGGLAACGLGIGAGILIALALGRSLSGILFGVSAFDPATFAAAGAALTVASAAACWLPARRALRISPALALREG